MKRSMKATGHFLAATALLLSACGKTATTGSEHTTTAVTELPLTRGFYVSTDTACGDASNATLLLMRRDGFNGARDGCDFETIEQTGPQSYRVIERCADFQAGPDSATTETVIWQIPDDASFTSNGDRGWERSFRHCEQSSLPDPWRDNDISDLVSE